VLLALSDPPLHWGWGEIISLLWGRGEGGVNFSPLGGRGKRVKEVKPFGWEGMGKRTLVKQGEGGFLIKYIPIP
jgi:hypothetical protein